MVKYKRLDPEDRKQQILLTAVEYSRINNYNTLTQYKVAEAVGCSPGLVINYFNSIANLQDRVVEFAISEEVLEVVAQGVVNKHPLALAASEDLKDRSLRIALSH